MLLATTGAQARSALHLPRGAHHEPNVKITSTTSTRWAGYSIDGTAATRVTGSWVVPTLIGCRGGNSFSSAWVGIDGDISKTVEQTGTESDCSNGQQTNYAWYELYPAGTVVINMAVNPKDSFTGTVTYIGSSKFTLTLTDNTSKSSFRTTQTQQRALRNSVEWIVEAPSNRPLADFGQIPFTSTSATISGTTRSVATASPITMVNSKGVVRAAPPLLNGNPGVTWYHQ